MSSRPTAPEWLDVPADANALAEGVWPASALREDGRMLIAGIPVTALAARFGTPLYVLDEEEVRSRAVRIRSAFAEAFDRFGAEVVVYYAGKAFLCTEVVRWVTAEGLRVDVCSGGELAVALAADADPALLGFHGNNKSVAEIERAVAAGVGAIVIDSREEIDRVAAAASASGRVQPVRLRVNSGVHAHTHDYLATAHDDQKFGVPLADAPSHVEAIRAHASLRFLGLHCHIGSQIFESGGFAESASRLIAVHAQLGADVPELNLGGGFGIAYTSADTPTPIEEIAIGMAEAVSAACAEHGIPVPRIAIEPGRWIVGPAGVTLYTVGTVKPVQVDGGVRTYVSIDGGMSDNARPALYGADYSARLAARVTDAEPALVRVAGKHCESGDIVVDAEYLPSDVRPDDLLAVAATGAYCFSLASNYNYLARPAVVAVRDGEPRVIVRGETERDLLARDAGIAPTEDAR
ncbi:diaminopimelate decarboxylase [Glaciibacter flavus]|uniref:Diaminopimelate decarboxylase n=1 Tax=Orlajensenia flava TaxID=2565934 RepID=A0A4S4FZ31_9MICO|nr:diaminopimelate decarboxylase [Glaciibacter flavus]THG35631.1 diaminopimelate decarboxylase [Glaciibacter flavus]